MKYGGEVWWGCMGGSMVGMYGVKYDGEVWWESIVGKYGGKVLWGGMVGKYGSKKYLD